MQQVSTCAYGNCGFRDEVFLSDTGAFQFYQPVGYGRGLSSTVSKAMDSVSNMLGIN